MDEHEIDALIEQITLRKLDYSREFLDERSLPHTGKREKLRDRMVHAVREASIDPSELRALLDELDTWGNQRIRLLSLPSDVISVYTTAKQVEARAGEAELEHLLDAEVPLVPPDELEPASIRILDDVSGRRLRLVAAKNRTVMGSSIDIIDHELAERYPGYIVKGYKLERQKAVTFAEVSLVDGFTIMSTTLFRQGQRYEAEFEEFFSAFERFLTFERAEPVPLFGANQSIRDLPPNEVRLVARRCRTAAGGVASFRSNSAKSDMRRDAELSQTQIRLPRASGVQCNCYWEPNQGLLERVHTQIYAPEGEIAIIGQVREGSIRHVLRRILEINGPVSGQ